jgi:hypothetical protein
LFNVGLCAGRRFGSGVGAVGGGVVVVVKNTKKNHWLLVLPLVGM